jgi:2-hydroxychromene-2-carboxylate isomerase
VSPSGADTKAAPPAAAPSLVFWYEFASTYSYVAAFRIEGAAAAAGVRVAWRPFLLGPLLAKEGLRDSPFNIFAAKGRYMWRDLERLCAREGLAWRRPTEFPRNGLLAARVATIGVGEGWGPAFSKAVFRANFAEDRDIAAPEILADILRAIGQEPAAALERAQAPGVKDALRARTAEAERLGIFGAPTFQIGTEIFWGQDRLADAVAWARAADAAAE